MAKQQSTQALVDQLEEAVKTSKILIKQYNDLSNLITESAKQLKEGFGSINKGVTKGLADFNKLLAQTNKLTKEEEKNNQEKEKTEQQLIKSQQELSKLKKLQIQEQQAELRLQKQIRTEQEKSRKEAEKLAKQQAQENSAYSQQSKRLNELRKEYKDLAAQQQQNTKAGKKLLKEITKLDKELKKIDETVGQNQRSVGDYKKAMEGLNKTLGKLGVVAVVVKGFELLGNAFGNTINGANASRKVMNKFTATIQETAQRLGSIVGQISDIFSRDGAWYQGIININDAFGTLFDSDNWGNFASEIQERIDKMDKLVDVSTTYRKEIETLTRDRARLNTEYRTYLQIAENDTLSFKTREDASKKALEKSLQLGNKDIQIAEKKLELAAREIAIDLGIEAKNKTALQLRDELNELLKDEEKLTTTNHEKNEAFTQAQLEYEDARLEAIDSYSDALEKQIKLYSDHNELILDLDLDLLDNIKTRNEKIIASDRETFKKRREMLEDTTTQFKKGFGLQADTIVKQGQEIFKSELKIIKQLEKKGLITEKEAKKQRDEIKAKQDNLNVTELVRIANIDDAEARAKALKSLELGEKFTLRNSEVIRDYTTGIQDLTEAREDLNDAQTEYANTLDEISRKEQRNAGKLSQYEKKLRDDKIKSLEKEIEALDKLGKKETKIRADKYSELLDLQFQKDKEQVEKRKELIESSITLLENAFDKANEKRTKQIEEQLSSTQKRIDTIQQAAETGNQAAQESLAAEERKQAELQRKKEQQRKREQRQEMLIAGLNLLAENADNPNALGKSISDVTALVGIISSLPTFMKGSELVGADMPESPLLQGFKNDKHLVRVDGSERILTGEQNKALGNLSNDEVAELGKLHKMGAFEYSPVVASSNKQLEKEVREMTKAISTLHERIPVQKVDYNAKAKEYEHRVQSNNKTEVLRTKAKNIWR